MGVARMGGRRVATAPAQEALPGAEGMIKVEYAGNASDKFRGKSGALYTFDQEHKSRWVIVSDVQSIMRQDVDRVLTLVKIERKSGDASAA